MAGGAEAALLAGEGEKVFVLAVGAAQPGEAGVQIAAAKEGGNGDGKVSGQGAAFGGLAGRLPHLPGRPMIFQRLPDRRGARLMGAVASADHGIESCTGWPGPAGPRSVSGDCLTSSLMGKRTISSRQGQCALRAVHDVEVVAGGVVGEEVADLGDGPFVADTLNDLGRNSGRSCCSTEAKKELKSIVR